MIKVEDCDLKRRFLSLLECAKTLQSLMLTNLWNKRFQINGDDYVIIEMDDGGYNQMRFYISKITNGNNLNFRETSFWIQQNNCLELSNFVEPQASGLYYLFSKAYDTLDKLKNKYIGRRCVNFNDNEIYVIINIVWLDNEKFYIKAEVETSGREVVINRFNCNEWEYI